jgi:hypothetical protein
VSTPSAGPRTSSRMLLPIVVPFSTLLRISGAFVRRIEHRIDAQSGAIDERLEIDFDLSADLSAVLGVPDRITVSPGPHINSVLYPGHGPHANRGGDGFRSRG